MSAETDEMRESAAEVAKGANTYGRPRSRLANFEADLKAMFAPRWIACKDQMPPNGEEYLVYAPGDSVQVAYMDIDGWCGPDHEPSHWMPLPDPPTPVEEPR